MHLKHVGWCPGHREPPVPDVTARDQAGALETVRISPNRHSPNKVLDLGTGTVYMNFSFQQEKPLAGLYTEEKLRTLLVLCSAAELHPPEVRKCPCSEAVG